MSKESAMHEKTSLSLSLAAFLISSSSFCNAHSQSQITLFGVIDDGVVHTYRNKKGNGKKNVSNVTELRSGVYRGSRWGIRGTEDLGSGYSVGFTLDSGFKADDGSQTMGRLFGRESSLNVKGPFGELYLGRIGAITSGAGPMAVAAWFSPFGTSCGQFAVTSFSYMFNFQRADNSISYRTPKLGGTTRLLAQYSRDFDGLEDIDPITSGVQHGTEGKNTTSHYYAVGLQFNNKAIDFNIGTDRLTYSKNTLGIKPKSAYSVTFGGSIKLKKIKVYGGAQIFRHGLSKWINTYNKTWASPTYLNGYSVLGGFEYPIMGGQFMAAAGLNKTKSAISGPRNRGTLAGASLGYAYPLSKRTSLYLLINSGYAVKNGKDSQVSRSVTVEEAVGLTHFF